MKRRTLTWLGLAGGALGLAAVGSARAQAPGEPPKAPVFASEVELVTVDVVVLDGRGRPVRGLAREDLTIAEDGKPQEIASFEPFDLGEAELPEEPPSPLPEATNVRAERTGGRAFVVLVDDLGLTNPSLALLGRALPRFLERAFGPGDEVTLAATSGSVWWSVRMPEGREDLLALVGKLKGLRLVETTADFLSDWEAYRVTNFEGPMGETAGTSLGGPGVLIPTAPGADVMSRIVRRWVQAGVCSELNPGMCSLQVRARSLERDSVRRDRTRAVLAGVERAVFSLTGVRGRKELLFFSEGFLHDHSLPAAREVAGRCREANVVVNFLDVRGLLAGTLEQTAVFAGGSPNDRELGLVQMENSQFEVEGSIGLAEDTGGLALTSTNDLAQAAERIVDESRAYYLLGYYPPEGKGPRDWRRLEVKARRPGLKVRARKGYTLRSQAEADASYDAGARKKADGARGGGKKDKAKGRGSEATQPALDVAVARSLQNAHDADGVRMRAMSYQFEESKPGLTRVIVAVEIDPESIDLEAKDGRLTGRLALSLYAIHRDTGAATRIDRRVDLSFAPPRPAAWTLFSGEFELPTGIAVARVVARDERSGRLGAVSTRFEVTPPAGLRFATPLITDEVRQPEKEGGRPEPVLRARRAFAAAGLLYCQMRLLGATPDPRDGVPRVEASWLLRRSSGFEVRRGDPSLVAAPKGGPVVRTVGLGLDGLAGGDYELVLRAVDQVSGRTVERVEAVRLVNPS